jgi:hypothetical protein
VAFRDITLAPRTSCSCRADIGAANLTDADGPMLGRLFAVAAHRRARRASPRAASP